MAAEHGEHGAPQHGTAGLGASAALTRLAALQQDAATVYAAISAANATLESLASQRADAERVLRAAWSHHHAATRALAAHAQAKPGPLAQLLTGFRARREWLARQTELNIAQREAAGPLISARRMVSGIKREFAAQVDARAAAVTALRRLTAECVAVVEEIRLAEISRRESGEPNTSGADQHC